MCNITLQNQDQVLRELTAVECALLTSFGIETTMLMEQAQDLRNRLVDVTRKDGEQYRPAKAA